MKRCRSECEDGWKGKGKLGEAGAGCLGIIYLADGGVGGARGESHDTQGLPCFACTWGDATHQSGVERVKSWVEIARYLSQKGVIQYILRSLQVPSDFK